MARFIPTHTCMLPIYLHLCLNNTEPNQQTSRSALPFTWLAHYPVHRRPEVSSMGWLGLGAACDGQGSPHYWSGKSPGPSVDQGRGPSGLVWSCSLGVQVGFWGRSCRVTLCSVSSGHLYCLLGAAKQGWVFLGPWLNAIWMTSFY